MKLEYIKLPDGNIRLKCPVSVTGAKPGDRVARSPGNQFIDVKQFGTLIHNRAMNQKDYGWDIIWDEEGKGWINSDYIQVVAGRDGAKA